MSGRVLVDTNVWLALLLDRHSHHVATRRWLGSVVERRSMIMCRAAQQSILRLLTTTAVLLPYGLPPLTNEEALSVVSRLHADPRVAFADEPSNIQRQWFALARTDTASPKLWMDAYLAAFAIASQVSLVTIDAGFRQFDGLDPLVLTT